jgi:hypothetical protein
MLNCDGMLGDDFNHATLSFQEPNCTSSIWGNIIITSVGFKLQS